MQLLIIRLADMGGFCRRPIINCSFIYMFNVTFLEKFHILGSDLCLQCCVAMGLILQYITVLCHRFSIDFQLFITSTLSQNKNNLYIYITGWLKNS